MFQWDLKQEATSVPVPNVKHLVVVVQVDKDTILIQLEDYWIHLNLASKTYAIGAYEG